MFVKNWYRAIMYLNLGQNYNNREILYASDGTRQTSAAYGQLSLSTSNSISQVSLHIIRTTPVTAHGGVVFGTGTTQPTFSDINISGDIITTIVGTVSVSDEIDDTGFTLTALYTLTNTSPDKDITVGEVALFCGSGSSAYKGALLERTVLDEPVTIPAGGVGQVTYTIRMNYPTA